MTYEFDATNHNAKSITRNTATVTLFTEEAAIEARDKLVELGFECTPIFEEVYDAFYHSYSPKCQYSLFSEPAYFDNTGGLGPSPPQWKLRTD